MRWTAATAAMAASLAIACGGSLEGIPLGTPTLIEANRPYEVTGTELRITNRGASMASASDAHGNDVHYVLADVELQLGDEETNAAITEAQPLVWRGFTIAVTSAGFSYDEGDVTVTIHRAKE